jgi:hypothetical protein
LSEQSARYGMGGKYGKSRNYRMRAPRQRNREAKVSCGVLEHRGTGDLGAQPRWRNGSTIEVLCRAPKRYQGQGMGPRNGAEK